MGGSGCEESGPAIEIGDGGPGSDGYIIILYY